MSICNIIKYFKVDKVLEFHTHRIIFLKNQNRNLATYSVILFNNFYGRS